MRDRLIDFWDTLRNRPLAMIGVVAGLAVVVILTNQTVNIVNREINQRIEERSPCTGLSTRDCARKLLGSLTPAERREIEQRFRQDVRREAAVRARARRAAAKRRAERAERRSRSRRLDGGSTRTPPAPGAGDPSGGGSPGNNPPAPGNGTQPPSGGNAGSGGGGTPPPSSPRPPTVHVPPVTVPPVTAGPVTTPQVTTPGLIVPCMPASPIFTC